MVHLGAISFIDAFQERVDAPHWNALVETNEVLESSRRYCDVWTPTGSQHAI